MDFHDFLRDWLAVPGRSAYRLAEQSGVSQSVLSRYVHPELRRRVRPNPDSLRKLAPALGVSYEDLMVMAGYSAPKGANDQSAVALATAEWTRALQEQGVRPSDWPHAIRTSLQLLSIAGGSGTTRRPFPRRNGTRHSGTGNSADPSEVPLPPGYYRSQDARLRLAAPLDRTLVAA